jgi:membrane protease YdiL (CAAX protease family)
MNPESIRVLVGSGFFMMLLFLRLEADRFGAAEYDEPGRRQTGLWTRLSWYLIGFTLLGAIFVVHPAPHDVLFLLVGHRRDVIVFGSILALVGLAQAAAFALWRYGYLRLPPVGAYPSAAVNAIATAVIDEAAFRGVLLGTLIIIGVEDWWAILIATLIYVLTTRLGAPGRNPYGLLLAGGMGVACGWATLASGGIGAAIVGHAVTSFGVFVCTGHAGHVPLAGTEPEELELRKGLPDGWQDARRPLVAGRGAEPRDFDESIEPSGFADRAGRRPRAGRHSPGRMGWARSARRTFTGGDGGRSR